MNSVKSRVIKLFFRLFPIVCLLFIINILTVPDYLWVKWPAMGMLIALASFTLVAITEQAHRE